MRALWSRRMVLRTVALAVVLALAVGGAPLPARGVIAAVFVLLVGEAEIALRPPSHAPGRAIAWQLVQGLLAAATLVIATHAWWPATVIFALAIVSASTVVRPRELALLTAVAAAGNLLGPAILALPVIAFPLRYVHPLQQVAISIAVFPVLALILHLRARHLLHAQQELRETVFELEQAHRDLQTSREDLQRWNEHLNAAVEAQTAALEERNRYLSIINAVSFALAEPMDGVASLERAARLVARLLGARAAQVYQRPDETREVRHLFVTVAPEDIQAPRLPETLLRHVADTGQPLVAGEGAMAASIALPDLGEPYAVVPIVAKAHVLGAFALLGTRDLHWDDQQRHLLLLIGREIGVALENARLYREALDRAKQEEMYGEAVRILNSPGNRERIFQQALQHMGSHLGARELALITLPDGPRHPRLSALVNTEPGGEDWLSPIVGALPGLVSDRMHSLILGSGGEAPLSAGVEAAGIGTLVIAPITASRAANSILPPRDAASTERVNAPTTRRVAAGLLVIAIPAGVPWNQASTVLVWQFARALARRMERDELVTLQQQRIRELAALADIARTMQSGADIERLYAGFAQALRTLAHYRHLYIARLDEFGQLCAVPVFSRDGREDAPSDFVAEDRAHRWFALRAATGWRHSEGPAPSFIAAADRACLVVPMRPKGQVLGVVVLALDDLIVGDQLRIVEQAVEQLALALDSATLYQQATTRASHIQALSNLAHIVASVADLREAFAAFAEEVRWLIPFDRAVMLLVDNDERELQPYATYPDAVQSAGAAPIAGSIATVPIAAGGAVAIRRSDPGYADLDWEILGPDVREVAAVPVRQGTRATAIFALVHTNDSSTGSIDLDALEEVAGLLGVTIERLRLYERAEHSANHDLLTGLPNYRFLQQRLSSLAAGITDPGESALFMIDLDGLKLFNDALGHDAGDEVIRIVGRELQRICRADDFVARTGGDEFVLVLEGVGVEAAQRISERVHAALYDAHLAIPGAPARIGVSIGIAIAPLDATSTGALLYAADQAMYEAKFAGGHRTSLARDRTTERSTRSAPQRSVHLAETLVRMGTDGATVGERAAVAMAQNWVVGVMAERQYPEDMAPWARMIVASEATQAIANVRLGDDQEMARRFLDGLREDWRLRERSGQPEAAVIGAVLHLAAAAVRLAWPRIPQPEGEGLDLDRAVQRVREHLHPGDDPELCEALFAFVLADHIERRGARPAA